MSSSGRTMSVRESLLEDFKTLVIQEGMSNDTIFIKQDKGATQRTHTHSHQHASLCRQH